MQHGQRIDFPAGTVLRNGPHHADHPPGTGPDARGRQPPVAGRLSRPGTYLGRHRPQPRLCIVQTRRGRPAFSDRLRRGGVRRRTGLRRHRRTMAHRRAVRAGAPHSGRRRGTGPRRGGGIPAPCGDTRTGTRRQSLSHRHQLRQPDHAAAARTHGIHLLRESRLPERRTAGLRKTNLKTLRHEKTEPEAPLPGFFHFTVQRVTIFLKKSSRGTL